MKVSYRNRKLRFGVGPVPCVMLCLGLAPMVVSAQQMLEEVIVTAPKRTTSVFDYEGMLSVVSKEALAQQQVEAIDELGRTVAGLVFRPRGNRAYDNVTLRGQSSVDFYEPKVQVYIDGFIQDQATFGTLLPSSVKQVEVLYGPQGTLYGSGAVGGVIDVVTLTPQESPTASFNTRQSNLVEEYSVSASTDIHRGWSADVSGIRQDIDGEYKDEITGSRLGDATNKTYRARVYYDSADSPWSVRLETSGANIKSTEEQYVPLAQLQQRIAYPVENHYTLDSYQYGLTIVYDLGDITLTSLTSYQDRNLKRTVFGSYSPEDQNTTTQELRLSSDPDASEEWSYTMGVYYESVDFDFARPAYEMYSHQDIETLALFGELTWQFTDALSVIAGARAEERKVKANGASGALYEQEDDDFSAVSPALTLGYQLNDATRIYSLYSSGYKPGGYTRLLTPENASFSYDSENVDNIEAGIKHIFLNNRAQIDLAAYWTRNDDYQLYVGVTPNQYLQNVGKAESRGLDLNIRWMITEAINASLGYAWNRTEFTDYDNPLTPGLDLQGNKLPYTPEQALNLSVTYRVDLPGQWGSITSGLHANYIDKMYFDETNTIGEDAFTLYNLTVDWQLAEHYSVQLYGTNLTDKTYTTYGFEYTGVGELYQLGAGRETGVRFSAEF
jgi:pesticin/yersiniabactin receptor